MLIGSGVVITGLHSGLLGNRSAAAGSLPVLATFAAAERRPLLVELRSLMDRLRPRRRRLGPPSPGQWRAEFSERHQSFADYVDGYPVTARGARRRLYVQPLGPFEPAQRRVVDATANFLELYFGLPVEVLPDLPLTLVAAQARRRHPQWGDPQVLTTWVLEHLLVPRLPPDAAALVGLTAVDLWPGEGWNYVFGQASLRARVGVWSIYRYGDPAAGPRAFRLALLRSLKVASHEVGHMFSLQHCTAWECNLQGSNSLAETDAHPLALCPECSAKLSWATGAEPALRYRALADFCRVHALLGEALVYERSLAALEGLTWGGAPLAPGRRALVLP